VIFVNVYFLIFERISLYESDFAHISIIVSLVFTVSEYDMNAIIYDKTSNCLNEIHFSDDLAVIFDIF